MTLYCHTPGCAHADGIEVAWVGVTDTDPGYLSTEVCPRCKRDLEETPPPEEGEE